MHCCHMLFRHAADDDVRMFISAITKILTPLNPVCVYLRRESAVEAISFAKAVKGSGWAERVDRLLKQTGCENMFEQRFELELELIQRVESLCCFISGDNWDETKRSIGEYFLGGC